MSGQPSSQPTARRRVPYVLVIEPDKVLGDTYLQAFERAGFEVAVARSAQGAVDAADDHTPDCVVLELQLPGHNGVEFLHEFRSYVEWQHVPVILNTYTSPQGFAAVRPALKTLGVVAVLYKPQASLRRLIAAVQQALGQAAASARGAA